VGSSEYRRRPILLTVFGFVLIAQAVLLPIVIVALLFTPSAYPVTWDGAEVEMGSIRLELLTGFFIWFAIAAVVGPGLWKGHPLARHIAFGCSLLGPSWEIVSNQTWSAIPALLFVAVPVGGYLYFKPNVRRFFESYNPSKALS